MFGFIVGESLECKNKKKASYSDRDLCRECLLA
jgi:hypothetical protein